MKCSRLLLAVWVLLATCFDGGGIASGICAAKGSHPNHVSLAEVDWNQQTEKFEVALCLWPADLEKALGQQAGRSIDLAKEANIDQLMQAYIARNFFIIDGSQDQSNSTRSTSLASAVGGAKTASGDKSVPPTLAAVKQTIAGPSDREANAAAIKWFGYEADAKQVWLYFEVNGAPGADWVFENRVFFELNDDQLNHIQWPVAGVPQTLVVSPQNPRVQLTKQPQSSPPDTAAKK